MRRRGDPQAYGRAPFAAKGLELIERILGIATDSIDDLARESVTSVAEYLGLRRSLVASSKVYDNARLRGRERVTDTCRREAATLYVNPPGGRELYRDEDFQVAGIKLRFIDVKLPPYPPPGAAFVPSFSILYAIMRCLAEEAAGMVAAYQLAR